MFDRQPCRSATPKHCKLTKHHLLCCVAPKLGHVGIQLRYFLLQDFLALLVVEYRRKLVLDTGQLCCGILNAPFCISCSANLGFSRCLFGCSHLCCCSFVDLCATMSKSCVETRAVSHCSA